MRWSLDSIYTGFDLENYVIEKANLSEIKEKLLNWSPEIVPQSAEKYSIEAAIVGYIVTHEEFELYAGKLYSYAYLRHSENL